MTKRLRFEEMSLKNRKTQQWLVTCNDVVLGAVRFYGSWRQFCFFPDAQTLYERSCLREIADFCEKQSATLRQTWKKRKPEGIS